MANVQRYVDGNKNIVEIRIASGVTVELGDLMFLTRDGTSPLTLH